MQLYQLIAGLKSLSVKGSTSVEVAALCQDNRLFKAGDLFIAIRGSKFDGHSFLPEACQKGASAVVVEDEKAVPSNFSGAVIKVDNSRRALDFLASRFYGSPSDKMFMVGVTGTNGKTTTSHMIEAVLNYSGRPTAVMGTIDNHLGSKVIPSTHTTPDALDLQRMLGTFFNEGAKAVSMEVSSHALAQARVDSVVFDVAVFTNLTRDHLDFHQTIENYVQAKARLFNDLLLNSNKKNKRALVNCDDPQAGRMIISGLPTWTYGLESGDLHARNLRLGFENVQFTAVTPVGEVDVSLKMTGRHNVLNSLAAIGVGLQAEMKLEQISKALSSLQGVRGRLQKVPSTKRNVHVFVDYAHSDDALKNVLTLIKTVRDDSHNGARIITVFGCGGDRDRGKRPLMMKVAMNFSELVIVTSDNPRTEDPQKIIDDIVAGAQTPEGKEKFLIEPDRRLAIKLAIEKSQEDDVVLIAGKGHEDYQIIGTKKFPFDDVKTAEEFLR